MGFAWTKTTIYANGSADDGDDANGTEQTYQQIGGRCADNQTAASSAGGNGATVLVGAVHAQITKGSKRVALATSSNKAVSTFTIRPSGLIQKLQNFFNWKPFKVQYDVDVGITAKSTAGNAKLSFNVSLFDGATVRGSSYSGHYDVVPSAGNKIDIKSQGVLLQIIGNPGTFVETKSSPKFSLGFGTYTFNFETYASTEADGMMSMDASVVADPTFV